MNRTRTQRRHPGILPWLRALAFGGTALAGLLALPFYPAPVAAVLALAVAFCGRFMPELGVLVVVVALSIPLAAANLVAGALFLVIGVSTIQYLGEREGRVYLVVALAFLGTMVGMPWAVVVAAGLLMGAGEGAVAALFACLVIEAGGILVGAPAFGVVSTAGLHPGVVDPSYLRSLASPLAFGWLGAAFARIDITAFLRSVLSAKDLVTFIGQPVVWAVGASVAGMVVRPAGDPRRPVTALAGAAAGVAVLVAGTAALAVVAGDRVGLTAFAVAGGLSLLAAVGVAALSEWVFTPSAVEREAPHRATRMSTEDADVDDLLRMISSAEEELASKHTATRTVLMTDMKSFSRMTQDLGSAETAKRVQRHRDLLLPIIETHGGKGKSTGGDGLLAAFDSPPPALAAAVEMQRTLEAHNRTRPGDEPILVRIGVADGEVVLDRGGKPFLGDALNLAARIMSLADGEQVFTSREVFERGGPLPYGGMDHGEFRLKNISAPVDVVEVLWTEGQLARAPLEEDHEA
jgi:class 3 adenylate cyclase